MNKGHFRLLIVLGLVTVWYGAFGRTFHPMPFILGLVEMALGWLALLADVDFTSKEDEYSSEDDEPRNRY